MEMDLGGRRVSGDQENGIRVLVVEDDTEVVQLLQAMLEGAGYEVVAAYSGPEALEPSTP